MNPRVLTVQAHDDHSLTITFTNGERRRFDVKPYLDQGVFRELRSLSYFKAVRPALGTVQWPNEQDFCPDLLYEESIPCGGSAARSCSRVRPAHTPRKAARGGGGTGTRGA
ncbi:MAG: DUF2442 domain-containing protein [Candidatus Binatia bacterium]|jgi:hypothetical protein